MDKHEQLLDLLGLAHRAAQGGNLQQALTTFEQLLDHAADHFATEERWMAAVGLQPDNIHAVQHRDVLRLMQTVFRWCRDRAHCEPLVLAIDQLAEWFPLHTQVLDADLEQMMANAGFNPATG